MNNLVHLRDLATRLNTMFKRPQVVWAQFKGTRGHLANIGCLFVEVSPSGQAQLAEVLNKRGDVKTIVFAETVTGLLAKLEAVAAAGELPKQL